MSMHQNVYVSCCCTMLIDIYINAYMHGTDRCMTQMHLWDMYIHSLYRDDTSPNLFGPRPRFARPSSTCTHLSPHLLGRASAREMGRRGKHNPPSRLTQLRPWRSHNIHSSRHAAIACYPHIRPARMFLNGLQFKLKIDYGRWSS